MLLDRNLIPLDDKCRFAERIDEIVSDLKAAGIVGDTEIVITVDNHVGSHAEVNKDGDVKIVSDK